MPQEHAVGDSTVECGEPVPRRHNPPALSKAQSDVTNSLCGAKKVGDGLPNRTATQLLVPRI
jgi:hypothetical protein